MKKYLPLVFALTFIGSSAGYSAIMWTNTAGSNWSDASSWKPNQIPSASDGAIITNAGIYNVTLDTSSTVNSLVLGGKSGPQTLAAAGNNLTP